MDKNSSQVLTIYVNWDVRDKRTFYGRTKYEAMSLLIDWIKLDIFDKLRMGDIDPGNEPVPCLIAGTNATTITWYDLAVRDFGNGGGIIWQTGQGDQVKIYDAQLDDEIAAVFASYALTMGQWEELPVSPEDVPGWLNPTAVAISPPEPQEEPQASDLDQWPNIPNVAYMSDGEISTVDGAIEFVFAGPPDLIHLEDGSRAMIYPPLPGIGIDYYTAVSVPSNIVAKDKDRAAVIEKLEYAIFDGIRAAVSQAQRALSRHTPYLVDIDEGREAVIYPPNADLDIPHFTAVNAGLGYLGVGQTDNEAITNLERVIAHNLSKAQEQLKGKGDESKPILTQLPRTGRSVIVFPPSPPYTDFYTAVHTHLGVAAGSPLLRDALVDLEVMIEGEFKNPVDRVSENVAEALTQTVANPQTAVTKPLGRKVQYVYIGERTPKNAKERTFVWVKIDPDQNNGQQMGDDSQNRSYSNGQLNLVPEASIGDIYEFTLTNGTDTISKAPAEHMGKWINLFDISEWGKRESIVGS